MNELTASVNSLYRQWTEALSNMSALTDPAERIAQSKYLKELHEYAQHLKESHTDDELVGQPAIKLRLITSRPIKEHVVQTKKSHVIVR